MKKLDPEIQAIIAKHAAAASAEIAAQIARPVLDKIAQELLHGSDLPHNSNLPNYPTFDVHKRDWICSCCGAYRDPRRRAVTTHMRHCEGPVMPSAHDLRTSLVR